MGSILNEAADGRIVESEENVEQIADSGRLISRDCSELMEHVSISTNRVVVDTMVSSVALQTDGGSCGH